jgi:MoaA/NifB/PqqE/SkfB family radical SAM enzyme
MSDPYRIDGQKLSYHLQRVADWQAGKLVYPIYIEVSPAGACNHRCTFCGLDFMGYKKSNLDTAMLRRTLDEWGRLGVKSVMYAGEGEPLLHPDIADITAHGRAAGIDQAFTTNGVFLTPELAERLLPATTWIKVSFNGGTPATYSAIHRAKESDFTRVLDNLAAAVALRRRHGWTCTLGLQMILLPENAGEVEILARRARDLGVDYLVVKPYSQHPQSRTRQYAEVRYAEHQALAERLAALCTPDFNVVFRAETMRKWDQGGHPYHRCLALPFWSYVDASANVWGCSMYMGDERFRFGNLMKESFQQIWEGERRRAGMAYVDGQLDASGCRVNCRLDAVNRYLHDLRAPPAHLNFI